MGKRQNDLYADLDQRLADLARTAQSAPPAAVPPQLAAQAESQSYDAAHKLFRGTDYNGAITAFREFLKAYPASPKAPDALLNVAANQIALANLAGARKTLRELVAQYPGTDAAKLAQKRLSALK